MSRYHDYPLDCKVYVGNLGTGFVKHELQDAFGKFGTVRDVWVARNPPGFAFIQFEEPRDAEDAVRALNGTEFCGRRIRVDMSNNRSRRGRSPNRLGCNSNSPSSRRSLSRSRSAERRHYRSRARSRSRSPPIKSPSERQRQRRYSSRSSGSTASSRSRSSSSTSLSSNNRSKTKIRQ